jgi:acetyl esterase/lipase
MDTMVAFPKYSTFQYAPYTSLNEYQVCFPRPATSDAQGQLWIVYIHGGAWCDPRQDLRSFDPAREILLRSPSISKITAFASINYRLSPHSIEPQDPDDPTRNAIHPDHIQDVLSALAQLQQTYKFGERYILVGHSCGATLAFQVAMDRHWKQSASAEEVKPELSPPLAILAIEGIYDIPALVEYNRKEPYYRTFVTNAFGPDEGVWQAASPTSADLNTSWPSGRLVVIAHSREDELVEWQQVDLVLESLQKQDFNTESESRRMKLLELSGTHDQVWKEGAEVARAIEFTLKELEEFL